MEAALAIWKSRHVVCSASSLLGTKSTHPAWVGVPLTLVMRVMTLHARPLSGFLDIVPYALRLAARTLQCEGIMHTIIPSASIEHGHPSWGWPMDAIQGIVPT